MRQNYSAAVIKNRLRQDSAQDRVSRVQGQPSNSPPCLPVELPEKEKEKEVNGKPPLTDLNQLTHFNKVQGLHPSELSGGSTS